jgi:hypothetical protein
MREVISVHVGQAGVQIGNACCKSRVLFLRLRLCCWHGSNLTRLPRFFVLFLLSSCLTIRLWNRGTLHG